VINGLTDTAHPCQALADLYTLDEIHGPLEGKRLAYIGDANNVARSLAICCGKLGVELAIASPPQYQFDRAFLEELATNVPDVELFQTNDPREAVREAVGVYTDVWTSMGQESEQAARKAAFANYQVNAALMEQAPEGAVFLHCLPARRGEEVTDAVIDGHYSAVLVQAANRMHVQKGLLAWLLHEVKE
jgi:ornithine carbamoyltransferase